MRTLLVNLPRRSVDPTDEARPPLDLLALGGALLEEEQEAILLDLALPRAKRPDPVARAAAYAPDLVLAPAVDAEGARAAAPILKAVKEACPEARLGLVGAASGRRAAEMLETEPMIDVVIRDEAELSAPRLARALGSLGDWAAIDGLVFRDKRGVVRETEPPRPRRNLDRLSWAWSLIEDWDVYRRRGVGRAARFPLFAPARETPPRPARRPSPEHLAQEAARLHRRYGVRALELTHAELSEAAPAFERFLRALAPLGLDLALFARLQAAALTERRIDLDLLRRAGVEEVTVDVETDAGSSRGAERPPGAAASIKAAVAVLRQHGLRSVVEHPLGLAGASDRLYWRAFGRLLDYDPDVVKVVERRSAPRRPMRRQATGLAEDPPRKGFRDDEPPEGDAERGDGARKKPRRARSRRSRFWLRATAVAMALRPTALARAFVRPRRRANEPALALLEEPRALPRPGAIAQPT